MFHLELLLFDSTAMLLVRETAVCAQAKFETNVMKVKKEENRVHDALDTARKIAMPKLVGERVIAALYEPIRSGEQRVAWPVI